MKNEKLSNLLKAMGPGILFAGAAIGGSHLIQSTRAGADYGFKLLIIVLLVNLFKYPFFDFTYRYTAATGKCVLEGYAKIGKWVIYTFLGLSIITGIFNLAALGMLTAGVANFILGTSISNLTMSIIIVAATLLMLIVGRYSLLDGFMKVMMVILSITTLVAFILAIGKGMHVNPGFTGPDLFSNSSIYFIIALMGWMPAPVEASVWTSLWALGRSEQKQYVPTLKESLTDFNIGYIGTAIMAVFFLSLGAFVMYGTGAQFSNNGSIFSGQLISLYTSVVGDFMKPIISIAAFITLYSSLITVIDGYPRSIAGSLEQLSGWYKDNFRKVLIFFMIFLSVAGVAIIAFLSTNMKTMIDIATIISFLIAPIIAYINMRVVFKKDFPNEFKPSKPMKILSILGLIYLTGFSLLYLYKLFF